MNTVQTPKICNLVGIMQQAQAWARRKFFFTTPARLGSYHVGEVFDSSEDVLKQFSLDILTNAQADQIPGADAAWLAAFTAARNAWTGEDTDQADGQGIRAELEAMVQSITQQTMIILFAADGIWPHSHPESAAVRAALELPEDRPYGPTTGGRDRGVR